MNEIQHQRMEIANELIKEISRVGRKFFHTRGFIAKFISDQECGLCFIDNYIRTPFQLKRMQQTNTWRHFSSGGTLKHLVVRLCEYIETGQQLKYVIHDWGDGENCWGYDKISASHIRQSAQLLGILKS